MTDVHAELFELRKSIDLLDQAIICILAERMRTVKKVGQYKKKNDIQPLDAARWEQVLRTKKQLATENQLSPELVEAIFNQLHQHALTIERTV